MAIVTVITGLAGSGKTHYLDKIVGVERFNEGVRPDKPANFQNFLNVLARGEDCAIVEIAYIEEYWRDRLVSLVHARFPETIFEWVYFENDVEAAMQIALTIPTEGRKQTECRVTSGRTKIQIPGEVSLKIFRIPSWRSLHKSQYWSHAVSDAKLLTCPPVLNYREDLGSGLYLLSIAVILFSFSRLDTT
jgi:hypothetical protein